MNDFNGILDYFISELVDKALKELKKDNKEYAKIDSNNDKIMAKIEKMADKLSESDKKLIYDFCDGVMELTSLEHRHFYESGFRDCMKFMQSMNK